MTWAVCTVEDDGYHLHKHYYRDGALQPRVVAEHRHTWIDDHLARYPEQSRIYLRRGTVEQARPGNLDEVWATVTSEPLPDVTCLAGH